MMVSDIVTVVFATIAFIGLSVLTYFAFKEERKRIKRALDLKERQVVALEKMAGEK